ncbi:hypothetical protein L873DRAFT_951501 [Choiromyces venosus 120613-1]|uniref:Uncharacterized protein n=1 Tax=Choiromyces venosus 120613-1 TaxID=1336337 RepID=A0A3N4K738_9PEZI|nr:hypothetical protein L873DRAFT_951501 [Choiromyces venosus 120613-1]
MIPEYDIDYFDQVQLLGFSYFNRTRVQLLFCFLFFPLGCGLLLPNLPLSATSDAISCSRPAEPKRAHRISEAPIERKCKKGLQLKAWHFLCVCACVKIESMNYVIR